MLLSVDPEVQASLGRIALRKVLDPVVAQAMASAPLGDGLVRISSHQEGKILRLTISDNGPGIAAEDRQRIVQANEKVLDRLGRRLEHAGAGLVQAREVAQRANGDIFVEDAPEGGCAWIVELPLADSPSRTPAPPSPEARET